MHDYQARSNATLEQALANTDIPERLLKAMQHSTLGGGKRLRARLVYAAGTALGAPLLALDKVGAALECIHAYSLIHDDLPAMDDDELRRGKPTAHIEFDEATAILAGDALQAMAFELINSKDSGLSDSQCRQISSTLAKAAGPTGMVGGQMLDILATGHALSQAALEDMHQRKTGALITAAVICGAHCAEHVNTEQLSALNTYAANIGLAFQVIDDILDIEASTEQLGKPSGSDLALDKSTYPAILGLQESKQFAQTLYQQAIVSIATIGDNNAQLLELAALVVNRSH